MRKVISMAFLVLSVAILSAQTLQDAQREIDNEGYFKARQILFKLWKDPAANKFEVAYYLGNAYLKSDDADSAKIFYQAAYSPDTRTALGYVANGRVSLLNKDRIGAKANFDRALQTSKMKNANIYYEIGDAYFRPAVIDLAAAISNFEAAYNLDNKNTTIMLALGDAYLENSVNDNTMGGKAMNKYENASEVNKQLALAHIKKGRLSVRGRMYDQSIEAFNKALSIDQNYPVVYKELAEAYYLTKQYDKVKPNFEKYIALSPGDNQARTTLASLYFQSKEYDKAIEESNKGLANDPNNYIFQRIIGFSNFELKRYKEAAEANKKFWDNPAHKVKDIDYIYSARIAAQSGDTTGAFNYFNQALANDSSNCDLLGEYAKTLFLAKHYTEAAAQYLVKKERCGKLASLDVYYLGRAYFSANDSLRADSTFAEFITRNPTSPDGYYWRAWTNTKFQIQNPETFPGLPYYQKYIEIASADPAKYKRNLVEAYNYVGFYHWSKKETDQAKASFMKALEVDPTDEMASEQLKKLN
ncbi:MAG TPA: tetratricopeptide repeat protein [Chitinophagales bacterium]|nr:tetratricopeptide repeat protein [Chitinophagales bacterium]